MLSRRAPSPRLGQQSRLDRGLPKRDGSRRSVDGDLVTGRDATRRVHDSDYGGDAVLAGDDGAVRHHAAHLHHERARGQEEWSPTGIGRWSHQHFAGFEPRADRRPDDMRDPARDPRRCRRATYRTIRRGRNFGLRVRAVGEKDARYVSAALLAPIELPTLADLRAQVFTTDGVTQVR